MQHPTNNQNDKNVKGPDSRENRLEENDNLQDINSPHNPEEEAILPLKSAANDAYNKSMKETTEEKETTTQLLNMNHDGRRACKGLTYAAQNNFLAEVEDLNRLDKSERTVLHRAALDQNVNLIKELCVRAKKSGIKGFVNKRDKFGNTALINACVNENELYAEKKMRTRCIKALLRQGADPNIQNQNSLWTALNWCAFHGDVSSIQLLIQAGAHTFKPDNKGFYPLDLCGLQERYRNRGENESRVGACKELIDKMKRLILKFEEDKKDKNKIEEEYKKTDIYRFLQTPLLRASVLYWSIFFKLNPEQYIMPLLSLSSMYPEIPIRALSMKNCYHACCEVGNLGALRLLFDTDLLKKKYDRIKNQKFGIIFGAGIISQNVETNFHFFDLSKEEKSNKVYSKEFLDYIARMSKWMKAFKNKVFSLTMVNEENFQPLPYYQAQDIHGNTPMHLASFMGHANIVKYLLEKEVNLEIENKDGWRCKELKQHESIKKAYNEFVEKRFKIKPGESIQSLNKPATRLDQTIKKATTLKKQKTQEAETFNSLLRKSARANIANPSIKLNFKSKVEKAFNKALYYGTQERIIPDIVLVFGATYYDDNKRNDPVINRANFNISLIQTRFHCYLMSGIDSKSFYLMIKTDDKELEKLCHEDKIKIKLLNDYSHQPYDIKRKADFEPFRSRQRQEITLNALNNLVDTEQLIHLKVVKNMFLMHTVRGIEKIYHIWIHCRNHILPEPLSSFTDYFFEGKDINFSSITALRSYFGEKFSFYFAWVSFYTCNLPLLAIPGLAVYFVTHFLPDTQSYLIPAWVAYNSIVSTLMIERWKRKSAEIATRWGTLNLLDEEQDENDIRRDFVGDEIISRATGSVTKYNKQNLKGLYYTLSAIMLVILGALVIGSFLLTQSLNKEYPDLPPITKVLVGSINGVVVSIANFIYEIAARSFVDKENHKYEESYEKSLTYKMFIFKALNSYLGVFYLTFIVKSSFDDLFFNLVSLLATNQISSIVLSAVLPWLQYKYNEKMYFNKLDRKARSQWKLLKDRNLVEDSHKLVSMNSNPDTDYYFKRPILDCKSGKPEGRHWDLARVELNSLRIKKRDIIDYYGNMVVQFGYITMFASAFPLGPAINLIANIIDTKAKIWTFLYVNQRPIAEKAGGIGPWLDAWEATSVVAIFVNALVLFFNLDTTLGFLENLFLNAEDTIDYNALSYYQNVNRLWVFVIAVHLILLIKILFIGFIHDKPKWVVKEEEKREFEEEKALDLKREKENFERKATMAKEDVDRLYKKKKTKRLYRHGHAHGHKHQEELSSSTKLNEEDDEAKQDENKTPAPEIKTKEPAQNETTKESPLNEKTKEPLPDEKKDQITVYTKAPVSIKPLSLANLNLSQAIKGVLFNTFTIIERELYSRRIADINKLTDEVIVTCEFCSKQKSTLICLTCYQKFCQRCSIDFHAKLNTTRHNVVSMDELKPGTDVGSRLAQFGRNIQTLESSDQENIVDIPDSINYWRKFESFNFPVQKAGDYFSQLKVAFHTLYKIYITNNAITKDNKLTNIEKPLKFVKPLAEARGANEIKTPVTSAGMSTSGEKLLVGTINSSSEEEMEYYLNLQMYNVEEKFLMNRIAFLNFKRRGAQATFDEFFKKITTFQQGSLESKLFLVFDLMDEDDDGYVTKKEVEDILKCSFVQNVVEENQMEISLKSLLFGSSKINKKALFQTVLKNQKPRNLLGTLTQTKNLM